MDPNIELFGLEANFGHLYLECVSVSKAFQYWTILNASPFKIES